MVTRQSWQIGQKLAGGLCGLGLALSLGGLEGPGLAATPEGAAPNNLGSRLAQATTGTREDRPFEALGQEVQEIPLTGTNAPFLTLTNGDSGDAVVALQTALQTLGYYEGPLDGNYGPGTLAAVEQFQADQGEAADGVVGPRTWVLLQVQTDAEDWFRSLRLPVVSVPQFTELTPGLPEPPPSFIWLIIMPLIPLAGGAVTYLGKRLQTPPNQGGSHPLDPSPPSSSSRPVDPNSNNPPSSLPRTSHWDRSSILLVGLFATSLAAFAGYMWGRGQQIEPTAEVLEGSLARQSQRVGAWFSVQQQRGLALAEFEEKWPDVTYLLESREVTRETAPEVYAEIEAYLQAFQQADPSTVTTLLLLNRDQQIVLSTNPEQEGETYSLQYATLVDRESFIDTTPLLYRSPENNQPLVSLAYPLQRERDETLGTLVIELPLTDLAEEIAQPLLSEQRRYPQLDTFLLTQLPGEAPRRLSELSSSVAEPSRSAVKASTLAPESSPPMATPLDDLRQTPGGMGLYLNEAYVPVMGAYRALPQHLAVVAELPQSEIFQPGRKLTRRILFMGWGLTGLLCLTLPSLQRKGLPFFKG